MYFSSQNIFFYYDFNKPFAKSFGKHSTLEYNKTLGTFLMKYLF